MSNVLFDALFAPHAASDAPFVTLDNGRVISFSAFSAQVAQTAHALTAAGVVAGDRIVVHAPKTVAMRIPSQSSYQLADVRSSSP